MVEKVRISVAMITYNGEAFLREQLASILSQLGTGDELVISDDGSTDGTLHIIEEFTNGNVPIRLLTGPGVGIKANVEHVLRHCNGKYIFLADQDDVWAPDKIKEVMKCFKTQKASLVIHDAIVFTDHIESPVMDSFFAFRHSKAGIIKNLWKNSYIGCCMAFRRELLNKALPIPAKIEMHDQWLGILNDFYYSKSYFYHKPLLYYRRHRDNNTQMHRYGFIKILRNRIVFLGYFIRRIF
ncbi:MAG: glycosyltransferase family 2 protein [Lachnospiraceae bacterium]|nr:glycosyltransferase family 2 protein [Lachnospiraceae bacterium]